MKLEQEKFRGVALLVIWDWDLSSYLASSMVNLPLLSQLCLQFVGKCQIDTISFGTCSVAQLVELRGGSSIMVKDYYGASYVVKPTSEIHTNCRFIG